MHSSSSDGSIKEDVRPGFKPLSPEVKEEEGESDKEGLVVDENPRAQNDNNRKAAPLKVKLSSKS